MKYAGIIFDLDGVICSTDRFHYLAWKALADRLGIPFCEADNERLRGVSRLESLEIILEKSDRPFSESEKMALTTEKNENYRQMLSHLTAADMTDEVRSTLQALQEHGIKLAIGSSSRNAPLILQRIGMSDFFDAVADGNQIVHSKPHPEVFLKAANMLRMKPECCLVVEDARAGIEAAIAGGFDCAAIGDARDDARARFHLNGFSDLLKIL